MRTSFLLIAQQPQRMIYAVFVVARKSARVDARAQYRQFQRRSMLLSVVSVSPLFIFMAALWLLDINLIVLLAGAVVVHVLMEPLSRPLNRLAADYYSTMPRRLDGTPFDKQAPTVTAAEVALFERRPLSYHLINGGYLTIAFVVMGLILGLWR